MSTKKKKIKINLMVDEDTLSSLKEFYPMYGSMSHVIRTLLESHIQDLKSGTHDPRPHKKLIKNSNQIVKLG